MRQLRIAKTSRTRRQRYDDDPLMPLDPRDPDIVLAKRLAREADCSTQQPAR